MSSAYPIEPDATRANAADLSPADLAALIASRICHDLVSPVGAICNGIDLMRELGGSGTDELAMIGQSATRASDLLQFYRLAFGAVADGAGPIARDVLFKSASSVIASNRCAIDWDGVDGPAMERTEARLIGLMLLTGRAMLGLRGRLSIQSAVGGGLPVRITAQSDTATCSDSQYAWIMSPSRTTFRPDAREIEFLMIAPAARAARATLEIDSGTGYVDLTATPGS